MQTPLANQIAPSDSQERIDNLYQGMKETIKEDTKGDNKEGMKKFKEEEKMTARDNLPLKRNDISLRTERSLNLQLAENTEMTASGRRTEGTM